MTIYYNLLLSGCPEEKGSGGRVLVRNFPFGPVLIFGQLGINKTAISTSQKQYGLMVLLDVLPLPMLHTLEYF